MKLGDTSLGILVLIGGLALFWAALGFSPIPGQVYGAQTMPKAVGVLAIGVGLALILNGRAAGMAVTIADWARDPGAWGRLLAAIALIVAYILLAGRLGFALTAFALLIALMLLTGTRLLTAVIVAIGTVIVVQYSFGQLLRVPLPRGDLLALPF